MPTYSLVPHRTRLPYLACLVAGSVLVSSCQGASPPTTVADAAADAPPAPPPTWSTDPKRLVRNVHQTWQHDTATTMTLSWTTELVPLTAAGALDLTAYTPRVIYAPEAKAPKGELDLMQHGTTATGMGEVYEAEGGAFPVSWAVELTGLAPDTAYVARVGTWQAWDAKRLTWTQPDLSPPIRFRTAPVKGSLGKFKVVMAGDSRGGMGEIRQHAERFAQIDALVWFFNGDMQPLGTQLEWNDWFDAMAPVLRSRPLMPVQGNHEVVAANYYGQFWLPAMPGLTADYTEHAWSIDIGQVHFVGLDSNGSDAAADEAAWLAQDLAAAQKDPAIKFTVAMMHHAPYSASNHGSTAHVQKHWVPLFDQYGVDLVFAGHDHNYERTKPLLGDKEAAASEGVTYIVAGGFFAPAYKNGKEWFTAVSHHGNKRNYCELEFDANKVRVTAWSGDGKEKLDEVEIVR
jgi:hypothetical protein